MFQILVVDDDKNTRMLFKAVLQAENYTVFTAENGEDAVLSNIVEYELVPLLKEYWFDEPIKVKNWTNNLRSAIK